MLVLSKCFAYFVVITFKIDGMKKIILYTFLFFISFAASAQSAQSTSEVPSFRFHKPSFKVFPNPATEYFQLKDESETVSRINVYNIVGKKIKTFEVDVEKKYYVDRLPKGMYLVQLLGQNNKIIATQRLNIKRP